LSAARALRHAVVSRLARTLGHTVNSAQVTRPVATSRSPALNALAPATTARERVASSAKATSTAHTSGSNVRSLRSCESRYKFASWVGQHWLARRAGVLRRAVTWWVAPTAEGRAALVRPCRRRYGPMLPRASASLEVIAALVAASVFPHGTAWPNKSFNRTANGRPPSPGWRYAVHSRQPGPGVLPSSAG
jgi:hypothetical protein